MTEQLGVQADKLGVKKGHSQILRDMSFSIRRGSITGLIGPSGSGKTTLMRAMVGVQKVNSGRLTMYGLPAGAAALRKIIGYVTQASAIYEDLTVTQNIRYFASLTRAHKNQVSEVIKHVHLDEQRHQLVQTLSGGQKMRVSLAIALLGEPELLILDEPTVGLDPVLREEFWKLFRELAKKGKTLIISSHVMDEAERCDNLLLLRNGSLLWHDTPKKLLEITGRKTTEEAFIQIVTHADHKKGRS